jgi:flagellar biosynthesis protein FliP
MGDYNDAFMRNPQNAAVQGRTKVQNRANVQQLKLVCSLSLALSLTTRRFLLLKCFCRLIIVRVLAIYNGKLA